MKLTIASERDGELVIAEECSGLGEWSRDFAPKRSNPEQFLCCVLSGDVFGFRGRKSNDRLLLQTPGNGATVNYEGEAGDGMSVLL